MIMEPEKKIEIVELALRLVDLLDSCDDLDFIDTVVDAVKYNQSAELSEYII